MINNIAKKKKTERSYYANQSKKKKNQIPTAWPWSLYQMTSGTKAADTLLDSTK